ncbi:MAG: hypothetical protein K2Q11_02345 [Burkholderiaceae bacterium]|nr:hypothetical protein [Burkholderiaceae bacterium]
MNHLTPAIVAQKAVRRLPRLALLLLCLAYILPGFLVRDPWRGADMAAFGYMHELALGHTPWSAPQLLGMAPDIQGLLPYWLGAWALQGLGTVLSPELAVRLPFIAMLVLTLSATWYGVYWLARSRGAQPLAFAFGGEAQPTDYAHAMADGALLALLASLGLAQPAHEITSYLPQLCFTTLVFFALAAAPHARWSALLALSVGLAGLVLSGAPVLALLYGAGGAVLCWLEWRSGASKRPGARWWSLSVLVLSLAAAVLAWQLDVLHWRVALPPADDWGSLGRLLLWFTWPTWPLALWTLWRWRKQIATTQPHRHLLLPLWFVLVCLGAMLTTQPSDRALLPALPALAALAAFALPTLSRSVAALVDWFTLLFFTSSAIAIWVIWISTQTGIPAQPAANVARLAKGFVPEFSPLALLMALTATGAWCALVAWRAGRHRAAIWKSLVLPAGGATLCWLLLMTLWLPMLNYARSDAPQVRAVVAVLGQPRCVLAHRLSRSQVAALQYHGELTLVPAEKIANCTWLVVGGSGKFPRHLDADQWLLQARIARPTDKTDALVLYRKSY